MLVEDWRANSAPAVSTVIELTKLMAGEDEDVTTDDAVEVLRPDFERLYAKESLTAKGDLIRGAEGDLIRGCANSPARTGPKACAQQCPRSSQREPQHVSPGIVHLWLKLACRNVRDCTQRNDGRAPREDITARRRLGRTIWRYRRLDVSGLARW